MSELLPQLVQTLKPHDIPLNEHTMNFHRHVTSITDKFFYISNNEGHFRYLLKLPPSSLAKGLTSEDNGPKSQPFAQYLRYLLAHPISPSDLCSGFILLSSMRHVDRTMINSRTSSSFATIDRFFGEVRNDFVVELAKLLGLDTPHDADHCLDPDWESLYPTRPWLQGFEYLLGRVSEKTQFSDLGTVAVALFLSRRPHPVKLFFYSDDEFGLKMYDKIVSSSKMDVKTLWTLFTPSHPHNAARVLQAISQFMARQDSLASMTCIWSGWFPSFINAVDPSKLPFTADFIQFHTHLIEMLGDHVSKIRQYEDPRKLELTDQLRRELDETYHAFYTHTKEYVVHLSLHPFALDNIHYDEILNFLSNSYLQDFDNSLSKTYREEVRKVMDATALSSSSPPFILTSELVCCLTDDEIIDIVDRIVALLDRDSLLDDDTILRICAFNQYQLSRIHLPDLFRKAGRSTEQFLHAFECLLSLPIDHFDRAPINYLLSTRWNKQPTLDEWDEVDLRTVGIVQRMISQNQLSVAKDSTKFIKLVVEFIVQRLPQIRHCAARLCQSQLDRLLAPSVDFLCQFFIHTRDVDNQESKKQRTLFIDISKLCDQRVIARCLNRTGFFSRFVTALFDLNFDACAFIFRMIVDRHIYPKIDVDDQNTIRRTIPNLLEEGWQDTMEFVYLKKTVFTRRSQFGSSQMMMCLGANMTWWESIWMTR